jgi:type I restriction enzyme S subunit
MTTTTKNIPVGYKQTEIGMIPADWRISAINDLGTIIDGDRGSNYPNGDDFSEYGYCLFLNAKNVTKNGFRFEDVQFIKKEKDAVLSKGKLKRGDIVLTTRGTVGNIAFFDRDIPYENIRINSGMVIIRIDEINGVTPDYYHKLTQSNLLTNQIDRLVFGSAQPQLTVKSIATFQFPVPTQKNEQKSIVITLSDADALIRKLEKLIEKKKNIKLGAMQELLTGQRRLAGFSGKWETKTLGEVANINKGIQKGRTKLTNIGKYPVWNGGIEPSGYSEEWNTNENTITISEGGNSCGFVNYCRQKFWLGGHCYAIQIIKNNIDLGFFYQKLKYNEAFIMSLRVGSGLPNIQKKNLLNIYFTFPNDKSEQTAIATVLSDMDTEIDKLESQLAKYRNIKQGMM